MNKHINVAYIGIKGLPAQAGVDRVVQALVTRMPAFGINPYVYCDTKFTPPDFTLPGVNILRISSLGGKYSQAPGRFIISAINSIRSDDFDLIHLHNIEASFVLPMLKLKYHVISTAHGYAYWRSKWNPLAKKMLRLLDKPFVTFSDVVTSVSLNDANNLFARFGKKIEYIPNGVSLDYHPDEDAALQILSDHKLKPKQYFLFVAGRIDPTKGAHLAIEAIKRLEEKIPLLIVGDIEQSHEYANHLREIADSSIFFQPLIKKPETLFGLMTQSIGLIFPSLVEAMSMVLLEAASLGVPVIASDISENFQIFGEDFAYFSSNDIDSLKEKLEWAINNSNEFIKISTRAKQRIHLEYGWDRIASVYADLYWDLCEKRV